MSQTSLKVSKVRKKEKGERRKKRKEVSGEKKGYGPRRTLVVIQ
jgi:hypothetical protein